MIWKTSIVWGAGLIFAMVLLQIHQARPAREHNAPPRLTGTQRSALNIVAGTRCLVMFQQPYCPCTRIARKHLRELIERHDCLGIAIRIVNVGRDGSNTVQEFGVDQNVHGTIQFIDDRRGQIARELGVHTSGHVLLFDQRGKSLFSGGITAGRGHEGPAAGLDKLHQLLQIGDEVSLECELFPVWGCDLGIQGPQS